MSFVDTNILVYATAPRSPQHARAQTALVQLTASGPVAISRQVLREYLAVMTRGQSWADARPASEAFLATDAFLRLFRMLDDGPNVWDELKKLSVSTAFGGKQVHDANVVATMLAHGETRLLTFDGAHFRRFGTVIEVIEP